MTARRERAVRVAPGTTSDRRDTVGNGFPLSIQPLYLTTPTASEPIEPPSSKKRKILENLGLAGGSATKALGTVGLPKVPLPGLANSESRAFPDRRPEPLAATADPFSTLYEFEHHRGTLEILFLLYSERTASKSQMRERLRPGPEAIEGALRTLIRLGLVQSDSVRRFPFTRTYWLTERGRGLLETPPRSWPLLLQR